MTNPLEATRPDDLPVPSAVFRRIVGDFELPLMGMHGLPHWARVLESGRRLATATGADRTVVELFALLHDARRTSEGTDPDHARRGALLARELCEEQIPIGEERLALLVEACEGHAAGQTHADATVATCWDADRLDLWRVGVQVTARMLSTEAARERRMMGWAWARSAGWFVPAIVRRWTVAAQTGIA